jgi:nucleoside 2-deoxyribosyltransferase
MIRVYTASKLRHAPMWRELCAANSKFMFHARWLKHNKLGTKDTPENARQFWLEDEQDVKDADVCIVYAEGDDHLRGALVEAGMAIAYGVPVIVIGGSSDYGTWQYHPMVSRATDLAHAVDLLKNTNPREF